MSSPDFFDGEIKGELIQLRNELDSNDPSARKTAAKRVVSLMRSGENVGQLFASMLRCVKTSDLELKRLVYHYIVTYSQQESEQSIMVVNTFIQDSKDMNPFVRALAVRTMSRIRIESVAESMIVPIKESLRDKDPFVRKTAALAVAKLFDIIPEAVENAEMFTALTKLLSDDNPMVISNTTAAICEINEKRSKPIFSFNKDNVLSIVSALQSSSEWCQTILLDALSQYEPESPSKAATMIDRLMPFLKHANASVVIGAFKCIFLFMDFDERRPQDLFPQIIPPFITLVTSAAPEIQFVVLRTLSLFVIKYPKALAKEVRVFFCKYNDPSFIKLEKLSIIVTNSNNMNITLVLDELAEYCNAIDVLFVRKTIRSLGQIAIKIPSASRRCVDILVKLVEGKADYAVEESIIVLCDLLRRFPGEFESIIGKVCTNIDKLKDPQAKASLIWILGEYCNLIEKVDILLDPFLDTFHDEQPEVQIQLITAVVKVYLTNPEETKDQLQFILTEASKETVLPDVRNRAMIYWRLLSIDGDASRRIISFTKDRVEYSGIQFNDDVLLDLIRNMGMSSGVLHIVPSRFVRGDKYVPEGEESEEQERNWRALQIQSPNSPVTINSDWGIDKYYIQIINISNAPLSNLALAANGNASGFQLDSNIKMPEVLAPNESYEVAIPFSFSPMAAKHGSAVTLVFALRAIDTIFFTDFIDIRLIAKHNFNFMRTDFLKYWSDTTEEMHFGLTGVTLASTEELKKRRMCIIGQREGEACLAFALAPNRIYICDIEIAGNQIRGTVKGDPTMFPFIQESAKYAFCTD